MINPKHLETLRPKTRKQDRVNICLLAMKNAPHPESWGYEMYETSECIFLECSDARDKLNGSQIVSQPLLRAVFKVPVTKSMLNPRGALHGGCQVTIFDNLSTCAYVGLDKFWKDWDDDNMTGSNDLASVLMEPTSNFGVSRNLSATYLRGVFLEETETPYVFLEVEMVAESRGFSMFTGALLDPKKRVCTTFVHDKAKPAPPKL